MNLETPEAMPIRGALIAEGKTKKIYEYLPDPSKAVVEYKNDITAFDDPSKTRQFETKAKHSNTTNARVFEMLNRAGIPTAFVRQLSDTEFLAEKCEMVPLELIARRYAYGSYTDRKPEYKREGKVPHRFDEVVTEFFLKTTKGGLSTADGERLVDGLDPLKGEEDPFIPNPDEPVWKLAHSKKNPSEADLGKTVEAAKVLPSATVAEVRDLVRRTFETIEAFFDSEGFHLVDFKIELGKTPDGRLVVADVIDNDSWRLRDPEWNELSKQAFRDKLKAGDEDFSDIHDNYALVAALLDKSKV